MKCYYNALENLIGYSIDGGLLIKVFETESIYRVNLGSWTCICEIGD